MWHISTLRGSLQAAPCWLGTASSSGLTRCCAHCPAQRKFYCGRSLWLYMANDAMRAQVIGIRNVVYREHYSHMASVRTITVQTCGYTPEYPCSSSGRSCQSFQFSTGQDL
ncbi:uncharacterized protein C8Q71DRAFT_421290 [Rhodofomes roseus]|uniref:Secreted protein n=1 Tax=Rhodofomes roseus TaxID=34475 RepID=A0ABQ8KQW1_9APHY|nr:uncharacterized protein C8Q71DRAFT_421290 [Rhodofomes roseus]KAH9840737.1 hypothetical protein C8Q71DRAFT_421290 [Rhodofomes roseus]